MKIKTIIIAFFTLTVFSLSLTAHAGWNLPWEKDNRSTIEKDKKSGYTETQRDYKARKRRAEKSKQGEGYENGTYKMKSKKYKKGKWQFIEED